MGNWIHLEAEVAHLVRQGFIALFCTSKGSAPRRHWDIQSWNAFISDEESIISVNPISTEEVKTALWTMKPFKAPGPDGLHARFFQRTWDTVGEIVIKEVRENFVIGIMPNNL